MDVLERFLEERDDILKGRDYKGRAVLLSPRSIIAAVAAIIMLGFGTVPCWQGWSVRGWWVTQELAAEVRSSEKRPPEPSRESKNKLQGSAQLLAEPGANRGPLTMSFYVYHAANRSGELLTNVNAGNLPAVMWYLHNEIVVQTPRKFKIDRIERYKVTMRNSENLYSETHAQFGPHVFFDQGRCTKPDCDSIWNRYGFVIGCATLSQRLNKSAYFSPFLTRPWGKMGCPPRCNDAVQYSLPGPCPSMPANGKTQDCNLRMPGGLCNDPSLLGKPGASCTYFVEEAGNVSLDELVGIRKNFWSFSFNNHFKEYDSDKDAGVGIDFWDGKLDPRACTARMKKVIKLFKKTHPSLPETFGEPPCDSSH